MSEEITVQLTDDQVKVLRRGGVDASAIALRAIEVQVTLQLEEEEWQRAEAAGLLYEARFMRYFMPGAEKFLTAVEAADFLDAGEDEGSLSSIGVFDGSGQKMDWSHVGGWGRQVP